MEVGKMIFLNGWFIGSMLIFQGVFTNFRPGTSKQITWVTNPTTWGSACDIHQAVLRDFTTFKVQPQAKNNNMYLLLVGGFNFQPISKILLQYSQTASSSSIFGMKIQIFDETTTYSCYYQPWMT